MASWLTQITPLPIRRPSSVVGYTNGHLPSGVLVAVDVNRAALIEPVATSYLAMRAAAAADGVELGVSSIADAYRSYSQQERSFRIRYRDTGIPATVPRPTSDAKAWNGGESRPPTWWDKLYGFADSAVPGTSNHGWACAVDIANAGRAARLAWLEQHAQSYGFMWENPRENWHLTYVAADEVPPALRPPLPPVEPLPVEGEVMDIIQHESGAQAITNWIEKRGLTLEDAQLLAFLDVTAGRPVVPVTHSVWAGLPDRRPA